MATYVSYPAALHEARVIQGTSVTVKNAVGAKIAGSPTLDRGNNLWGVLVETTVACAASTVLWFLIQLHTPASRYSTNQQLENDRIIPTSRKFD